MVNNAALGAGEEVVGALGINLVDDRPMTCSSKNSSHVLLWHTFEVLSVVSESLYSLLPELHKGGSTLTTFSAACLEDRGWDPYQVTVQRNFHEDDDR